MQLRALAPCLPAIVLSACTVGPDYARPSLPASPAVSEGRFLRLGGVDTAPLPVPARWWESLNDPVLNSLVDAGLANAPDIAAARARLDQARAQARLARASTLPLAGASSAFAHAELPNGAFGSNGPSGGDLFAAGFDAQWELDLWGGGRRSVEQRRAEAGAAEALLADAQVSLGAEIVRSYVDLRAAQAKLALAEESRTLALRHGQLVGQQVRGGTVTRQVGEAATRIVAQNEAAVARLKSDLSLATDALAVLTGQAPGIPADPGRGSIPLPPRRVAVGDPAAMLERRPDLRTAERRLAAATARVGVAEARRFPAVSVLGLIGIGGSEAGDLFDTSNVSTIAAPQLSWHFLDFGRSKAGLDSARSGRDAALAEYQGAVLRSLQDAEGALSRFGAARTAWVQARREARASAQVARLEMLRADAGTLGRPQALAARLEGLAAESGAIDRAADLTRSYAALAKALGLGWASGGADLRNQRRD